MTPHFHCSDDVICANAFGSCYMQPPTTTQFSRETGEGSYVFKLECGENQVGRLLKITGNGYIMSETAVKPEDFMINGERPTQLNLRDDIEPTGFRENNVYFWNGTLTWNIYINNRCGDTLTIIPSLATGFASFNFTAISVMLEECTDGQARSCYAGPAGTAGIGICRSGTQTCTHGLWDVCQGEVLPQTEICDGRDNDCNRTVDDGCECIDGQARSCYDFAPSTLNVGTCHAGTQACVNGHWGFCSNQRGPESEVCDGRDHNCNGLRNEGCDPNQCTDDTRQGTAGRQ